MKIEGILYQREGLEMLALSCNSSQINIMHDSVFQKGSVHHFDLVRHLGTK